jgi:DNA polymerase alpha-associated DNA helicase A
MEKALDQLEKMVLSLPSTQSSLSPSKLTLVLLGLSPPSEPSPLATPVSFFDSSLNPSQRAAVLFALEAKEVACIHGSVFLFENLNSCLTYNVYTQ